VVTPATRARARSRCGMGGGEGKRRGSGYAGGGPEGAKGPAGRTVVLAEGKDCVLNIQRESSPFGSIHGQLTVAGRPIPGATLRLVLSGEVAEASPTPSTATTDSEGDFQWKALSPGTYRIEGAGSLRDVDLPAAREIVVRAGRRSRVELDLQSLRHRSGSSSPARRGPWRSRRRWNGGPFLWLRRGLAGTDEHAESRAQIRRVAAATNGVAEASGLLPGRYRIRVRLRGLVVHEHLMRLEKDAEGTVAIPRIRRSACGSPLRLGSLSGGLPGSPCSGTERSCTVGSSRSRRK